MSRLDRKALAAHLAERLGILSKADAEETRRVTNLYGPWPSVSDIAPEPSLVKTPAASALGRTQIVDAAIRGDRDLAFDHPGAAAEQTDDLAAPHTVADAVDRAHDLGGAAKQSAHDREMLAQVLGQQQRLRGAATIGIDLPGDQRVHQAFTSMAARRPSLIRLKQIEVMKIITPGKAARRGLT